jgi:hypothetical protein
MAMILMLGPKETLAGPADDRPGERVLAQQLWAMRHLIPMNQLSPDTDAPCVTPQP